MGKNMALIGWLMAAAALVIGCAAADTHTVGDSLGWNIPPAGSIAYRTWAAKEDFELGDTITFSWTGTHNVVQVTKEGYDNCSAANNLGLGPVQTNSPYSFILNTTAPQYFICTVDNHCRLGQKVTIQVESSAAAPLATAATSAVSAIFLAMAISISLLM